MPWHGRALLKEASKQACYNDRLNWNAEQVQKHTSSSTAYAGVLEICYR